MFQFLVYSGSFNCYAFIFYFLLRFSFLPSSLALIASHPWLSVEVLFLASCLSSAFLYSFLYVGLLRFSQPLPYSARSSFSIGLRCSHPLFLPFPTVCLGPLLMAAFLCILISCCPLIPFSLALCLPRRRFAVRLDGTASHSPRPY